MLFFFIILLFSEMPPVFKTVWIQIRRDCVVVRDLGSNCLQTLVYTVKSRKFKVLGTSQSEVTEKMSTLNSTCCSNTNDSINEKQLKI